MNVTWEEFKAKANAQLDKRQSYIYRGQANSKWYLSTTIHRTGMLTTQQDFLDYFEYLMPFVLEPIEAWDGSRRDIKDPNVLAEFLSFLQNNGFPTPLLDWTFSPYIAAYFAFEAINHFSPQFDKVAIYSFNNLEWVKDYKQSLDWTVKEAHVSHLTPTYRGNTKQMLQQGTYLFTNQKNVENHIIKLEKRKGQYLTKYEISVKEKAKVFKELNAMNITAMLLAPSMESVCKKVYEEICANLQMGLSPSEFKEVLKNLVNRIENPPTAEEDAAG